MASVVKRSYLKGLSNYTVTILARRLCEVLYCSYKSEYMSISALKAIMIFTRATGRPQEHSIDTFMAKGNSKSYISSHGAPLHLSQLFFYRASYSDTYHELQADLTDRR